MRLKLTAETSLLEPNVDHGFVTWWHFEVVGDDDPTLIVGHGRVAKILTGQALNYGQRIYDVLDADSGELEALYAVYFKGKQAMPDLDEGAGSDILYFDELTVESSWQNRNIDLAIAKRIEEMLGDGCAIIILPYETEQEAVHWGRMGFQVTQPTTEQEIGYLHLHLAMRTARVVDPDRNDQFRVIPNPSPMRKAKQH